MKIAIIDYGAGNLHSIAKALAFEGAEALITSEPRRALDADLIVLPGVGAFGPAAKMLAQTKDALRDALRSGKAALGICLGMQLLFDGSEEGEGEGLGVFEGRVTRLQAQRTPHMGWAALDGTLPLSTAYFAHSYACRPANEKEVVAWAKHEDDRFCAAVRRGRVLGVQFHPEKSGAEGVALIRRFAQEVRPCR